MILPRSDRVSGLLSDSVGFGAKVPQEVGTDEPMDESKGSVMVIFKGRLDKRAADCGGLSNAQAPLPRPVASFFVPTEDDDQESDLVVGRWTVAPIWH